MACVSTALRSARVASDRSRSPDVSSPAVASTGLVLSIVLLTRQALSGTSQNGIGALLKQLLKHVPVGGLIFEGHGAHRLFEARERHRSGTSAQYFLQWLLRPWLNRERAGEALVDSAKGSQLRINLPGFNRSEVCLCHLCALGQFALGHSEVVPHDAYPIPGRALAAF